MQHRKAADSRVEDGDRKLSIGSRHARLWSQESRARDRAAAIRLYREMKPPGEPWNDPVILGTYPATTTTLEDTDTRPGRG